MQLKNVAKAIAAGALAAVMAGATVGFAATLADFPAPFITDGNVDTLIVVGSKPTAYVADRVKDIAGAINIAARLGSVPGETRTLTASGVTTTTVSGGVALDTTNTKLYFKDKIDKAKGVLTGDDLSVLGKGTVYDKNGKSYDYNQYLYIGGESNNDGPQIIFDQPTSTAKDPEYHVDLSADYTSPTYTLKVVFDKELNVSAAAGKKIKLFGKEFTISKDSDMANKDLILYGSSTSTTLSPGEETTVTVNGVDHTIKLIGITSESKAVISVDGETQEVDETVGSYTINGVDIYVDGVYYYEVPEKTGSVTLSVGSNKYEFKDGSAVKISDETVKNTRVTIETSDNKLSTLTIAVAAQDSKSAYIDADHPYTDPIFGTFKVAFNGLDSTSTEEIDVTPISDQTYQVSFTDKNGNDAAIEWAYEDDPTAGSTTPALQDSNGYSYVVVEGQPLSLNDYTILTAGDFYRLVQVTDIDATNSDHSTKDDGTITIKDVVTGTEFDVSVDETNVDTGRFTGTKIIDGQTYTFGYDGSNVYIVWGDNAEITDSGSALTVNPGDETVVYPVLETSKGAKIALTKGDAYSETFTVSDQQTETLVATIDLPTGKIKVYTKDTDGTSGTTAAGIKITKEDGTTLVDYTDAIGQNFEKVGQVEYVLDTTGTTGSTAKLTISLSKQDAAHELTTPALLLVEEKDKNDAQNAVIISAKTDTENDYIDLDTVDMTDSNAVESEPTSDTYTTKYVDYYGTQITRHTKDKDSLEIIYPDEQLTAMVAIGENPTWSTSGGEGGTVTYKEVVPITTSIAKLDSEVTDSDKNTKNLILVGGPCANSLVQELVDSGKLGDEYTCAGGTPGSAWEPDTGYIMLVNDAFATGKAALIVAGSTAEETYQACSILQDYEAHASELTGTAVKIVNNVITPITMSE